jgi:hypothetical protein
VIARVIWWSSKRNGVVFVCWLVGWLVWRLGWLGWRFEVVIVRVVGVEIVTAVEVVVVGVLGVVVL